MDLVNREGYEEELARVAGRALRKQYAAVRRALGSNPSIDKMTPAMFEEMRAGLQAAIRPVLERVYLDHAEALSHQFPRMKQGGIGIDWGLINERAAEWSSQYSFKLVNGITNTTRNTLQAQISDFFNDKRTLKDLEKTISNLFGPVRAAMIAQTEVTRAASAAEEAYAGELRKLGLNVTFQWITENDEIVRRCPICWPRHETFQGDGWQEPPPAHPRCRCWMNAVVIGDSTPISPLDREQLANRSAREIAADITPQMLSDGKQGPVADYMYNFFSYDDLGNPMYDGVLVDQARLDTLYNVHTLGRGQVPQRVINEIREQSAGILAADGFSDSQILAAKDRNLLRLLSDPDDDAVLSAIDKVRDRRLRGSLAQAREAATNRGRSYDQFVSAAAEDGANQLREASMPWWAQR